MIKHDRLYRYLFENHSVRGELVTVNKAYSEILKNHNYPLPVQQLLGEMLVATSLLTATLKFDGEITVQLQGDGPLSLAVINGNNFQQMRGVARVKSDISDGSSLKQMMGNGYLVITITPTQGERYQGIIGLEGETLAECIERYFSQSEQLPTRFFIRTGARSEQPMAGGMLLQVLPASNENGDEFEHLATLTATINAEELFNLEAEEVLYRLYHEEQVTLFEAQSVNFHCTCSRERCADTLMALPADEVDTMLAEDGQIEMNCDFCASQYSFDAVDIKSIRNGHGSVEADSSSIH